MNELQKAKQIAYLAQSHGGRAYFVGGCVRDRLMKKEVGDIDIEIHGLQKDTLVKILAQAGEVLCIGKSFGIYSLKGFCIDIALPRSEIATGRGHRDFDIKSDPCMGTKKAAMRRDFTVNALMEDILTGEVIDHFGGIADLEAGILRHVNDNSFAEDPLRVLRMAQFAARFGFCVHEDTARLCRTTELGALSRERVMEEMKKGLLAPKPSVFFEVLKSSDALLPWFEEVSLLRGVEQNQKYHKEGDVWTHTMMVLDKAAKLKDKTSNPIGFMISALFHDLGKIVATTKVGDSVHSYNHETEGIPLTQRALERITNDRELKKYVLNMCSLHMKPHILSGAKSSVKSTNKMFDSSVAPIDLVYLSLADVGGMLPERDTDESFEFLTKRYEIFKETMAQPYVKGEDLVKAGFTPDESFGDILRYAHKLRLAGVKKEEALRQVIAYAKKKKVL